MHHFFTEPSNIEDQDIYICGSDYNHIKNVLRLRPGDVISVSNGVSRDEYRCHIEAFETDRVHLRLDFIKRADVELPVRLILFQGLPKSDKMDFIVQKAVELGISEVVPVALSRCVTRLDDKKKQNRVQRWNTIAEAAAKQSKRAVIPPVQPVMTLEEALKYSQGIDHRLIPYELTKESSSAAELLEGVQPGESVGIFIGPEGGFEETEVRAAREAGFSDISLGKRILRTETAALVVLSWFIYLFEIRN
ncbi:MAG: 16S rRNA (uracil(1498)-N(3))-methyltransferase [Lachnospiraceae bacterium]|nr:16S rRNA (uracil(1498)-N(3))-methyltransferase [Lachnospiraceae bacterium]